MGWLSKDKAPEGRTEGARFLQAAVDAHGPLTQNEVLMYASREGGTLGAELMDIGYEMQPGEKVTGAARQRGRG